MGIKPDEIPENYISVGLLAHVDAGKTTLSEALLYLSGQLRRLGRVDHQDAFLDTNAIERERGITIFSKQAILPLGKLQVTLLDTPGHVDFSSEMERTLSVIDAAILVISGTDGVQGHTRTLWRLLSQYHVPAFIFVNKMDLAGADKDRIMAELTGILDSGCTDMAMPKDELYEALGMLSEGAMEEYLSEGAVSEAEIKRQILARQLFPVFFGSALKLDGVQEFLEGFKCLVSVPAPRSQFGARVYKISRDGQGTRLTYMKITGGELKVKSLLQGEEWQEKADQIRIYSGEKFSLTDTAPAGTVCAVTGLSKTYVGEGLGFEKGAEPPSLEPVLSYQAILPEGCDLHSALLKFRELEEEDPQLHIVWNERLREIHVQLMGEVQLEVLERQMAERFGLEVHFGDGGIVYRETITNTVEGVGHFEPLRHYAEVHLLLEPGERGSGLVFAADVSEDELDRNWQRLILTHLYEKTHVGVLTGMPITDMKITLKAGRASLNHTEGGDFREATYRAVRQGLMQASSTLLEPWYDIILEIPTLHVGRAISDLTRMSAKLNQPEVRGEETIITGSVPVSEVKDYARTVTAYTRGLGRMFCVLRGYEPCHNQEEVIAAIGYDPERDVENTPDSVFCAHGAGYPVKWYMVMQKMHLESVLAPERTQEPEAAPQREVRQTETKSASPEVADKELKAIFERTYGEIKHRDIVPKSEKKKSDKTKTDEKVAIKPMKTGPEYLLVDGYNIIFAWDELKKAASDSLDAARKLLMDTLSNYAGLKKNKIILVFDAYKVKGNHGSVEKYHNIHVVYTREAETADSYIEKTAHDLSREHKVWVATSDGPEQLIILGNGALRLTAGELYDEIKLHSQEMKNVMLRNKLQERTRPMEDAMREAEKKNN